MGLIFLQPALQAWQWLSPLHLPGCHLDRLVFLSVHCHSVHSHFRPLLAWRRLPHIIMHMFEDNNSAFLTYRAVKCQTFR